MGSRKLKDDTQGKAGRAGIHVSVSPRKFVFPDMLIGGDSGALKKVWVGKGTGHRLSWLSLGDHKLES